MIHIGENWYIGGDSMNITLYQKKTVKKKGDNEGNEYFEESGYYNTFENLLHALTRKKIRLSISSANSLEEVSTAIQETHSMIKEFCDRLEKEIKQMEKQVKGAVE